MKHDLQLKCGCGHAILELWKWPGIDDASTSFVFYEAYQPSLRLRIKKAWDYIRGKRLDVQDFVLYKEDMKKIQEFIQWHYGAPGTSIGGKRLTEMESKLDNIDA